MIIEMLVKTNENFTIEYLEFILNNGNPIKLDWDESSYMRERCKTRVTLKGILINEEYANGKMNIMKDISNIDEIGIYYVSEEGQDYNSEKIDYVFIMDGNEEFQLSDEIIDSYNSKVGTQD